MSGARRGEKSGGACAAAAVVTAVFAWICVRFAWQPVLASFADDSASYLVMGQVFSPWTPASPAVAEAFVREAFYPPLFPLLLGLTGAAHHLAWAHALTALCLAGALPLVYLLGSRWLGSAWGGLLATVAFALLPSLWIQVKGILSEPLFCLLFLALLLALERENSTRKAWLASLLMAALVLTRTAALVPVAAYAAWALTRRGEPRLRLLIPAIVAAVAYGAWLFLRPAGTSDDYMRIVAERAHSIATAPAPWLALAASVARQVDAQVEAWAGSLILFWPQGHYLRLALVSLIGALALGGLALRLREGRADAWMAGAYLVTFLIWPFYDQMTRFLFPLLPVLVLYALLAASALARAVRRPPLVAQVVLWLLVASLAVPALAFIHGRAQAAGPFVLITDWYRTPDLDEARRRAQVHLDLMGDMEAIRALTQPQDRVMWVAPSYVALLAQRRGVPAPSPDLSAEAYRQAVDRAHPDYLFLSVFHPRDTLRDAAWRAGLAALGRDARAVRVRQGPSGSILVKPGTSP
jgi:hypothetical protein